MVLIGGKTNWQYRFLLFIAGDQEERNPKFKVAIAHAWIML